MNKTGGITIIKEKEESALLVFIAANSGREEEGYFVDYLSI